MKFLFPSPSFALSNCQPAVSGKLTRGFLYQIPRLASLATPFFKGGFFLSSLLFLFLFSISIFSSSLLFDFYSLLSSLLIIASLLALRSFCEAGIIACTAKLYRSEAVIIYYSAFITTLNFTDFPSPFTSTIYSPISLIG